MRERKEWRLTHINMLTCPSAPSVIIGFQPSYLFQTCSPHTLNKELLFLFNTRRKQSKGPKAIRWEASPLLPFHSRLHTHPALKSPGGSDILLAHTPLCLAPLHPGTCHLYLWHFLPSNWLSLQTCSSTPCPENKRTKLQDTQSFSSHSPGTVPKMSPTCYISISIPPTPVHS